MLRIKKILAEALYVKRVVKNARRKDRRRSALLSYITHPFYQINRYAHTNHAEAHAIVDVLDDLGYSVDIVNYNSTSDLDYQRYDLFFGFGRPIARAFAAKRSGVRVVAYFTGMAGHWQNNVTLSRCADLYRERGVWLTDSARFVEEDWSWYAKLADLVFVLGNDAVKTTFATITEAKICVLPALYYELDVFNQVAAKRAESLEQAKKRILFVSGGGLVHKGLDLVLQAIMRAPLWKLEILASMESEPKFRKTFQNELNLSRVTAHGFVSVSSSLYRDCLARNSYVISPSCSEGGGSATVSAIANGGCIPIASWGSSIDVADFGVTIDHLSVNGVVTALEKTAAFGREEILNRTNKARNYFLRSNSIASFKTKLRRSLEAVL